jgi:hypothetical protein
MNAPSLVAVGGESVQTFVGTWVARRAGCWLRAFRIDWTIGNGGRGWNRTIDPPRVKRMLYR